MKRSHSHGNVWFRPLYYFGVRLCRQHIEVGINLQIKIKYFSREVLEFSIGKLAWLIPSAHGSDSQLADGLQPRVFSHFHSCVSLPTSVRPQLLTLSGFLSSTVQLEAHSYFPHGRGSPNTSPFSYCNFISKRSDCLVLKAACGTTLNRFRVH